MQLVTMTLDDVLSLRTVAKEKKSKESKARAFVVEALDYITSNVPCDDDGYLYFPIDVLAQRDSEGNAVAKSAGSRQTIAKHVAEVIKTRDASDMTFTLATDYIGVTEDGNGKTLVLVCNASRKPQTEEELAAYNEAFETLATESEES